MEHEIVAGLAQDESFVDGAMPPDAASLFKDPSSRPDYAVAVEGKGEGGAGGEQQWLRPEEKVVAGQRPSAELFLEEVCGGNVVQGTMDDRWFLGALAAVAAHPAGLLDNLFVSCDHWKTHGVITSRFFKDGEWLEVVVDTLVPVNEHGTPVYGRCADGGQHWVQLLEKAYAKLHGRCVRGEMCGRREVLGESEGEGGGRRGRG
jgi:hypothetical protein